MKVIKVYIDGLEFNVKMIPNQTEKEIREGAIAMRKNLPKLTGVTLGLVDGSTLVLSKPQLSRAVFVYGVELDTKSPKHNN